ncbi:hypothetical protein GON03_10955 [Nocardioides sp. MAH-18]|uniref:Bacterial Ig-like domain-containing protein n=1 Tax=Nocardioides agri TaxID=2682843 RepID=A0A6L6XRB3_9ACTN|nr:MULTISPECIES: hypothetical protein [unclassified Nocardioides]MBA2954846.1 hypothetical protein [Nocardioides sp. CGMCC 1.13656]MVQ49700.1 hypothetical protein [Nocardioides sp. MAH-18]
MSARHLRRAVGASALALLASLLVIVVPQPASAVHQIATVTLDGSTTQPGRMLRDGTASQCGTQKVYPGSASPATTFNYATTAFVAPTSGCLTVSLSHVTCVSPTNAFLSIYSAEYHPTSQASHYLGDQGSSGATAPPLQVSVEKGRTYVAVLNNTNAQEACSGDVTFDLADDTTPPDTAFVRTPPAKVRDSAAVLTFTGQPAADTASFQCQVDGAAFAACTSPLELTALAVGSHTVAVRALDGFGNADPSPAVATFVSCDLKSGTLTLETATAALAGADKAVAKAKQRLAKAKTPKARKKARKRLTKLTKAATAARQQVTTIQQGVHACAE